MFLPSGLSSLSMCIFAGMGLAFLFPIPSPVTSACEGIPNISGHSVVQFDCALPQLHRQIVVGAPVLTNPARSSYWIGGFNHLKDFVVHMSTIIA